MKNQRWYFVIFILIIVGFLVWYFSSIISYILVAAVLSIMGHPLVRLLNNIKIGKIRMPNALSALLTLASMMFIVFVLIRLLIPMISSQADTLSVVNVDMISKSFSEPLKYVHDWLVDYNMIEPNHDIEKSISDQVFSVIGIAQFSNFINSIVGFAKNVFVAIFAISFITFFFLKDERLFFRMVLVLTPTQYQTEVKHILLETKRMLTRYFIGLCLDIFLVITLITVGMWILGLENALVIGLFAGIMNIIPYVGPFIGASIGVLLGLSGNLDMDFSTQMVPLIIQMLTVFVVVNLIDAMVLQPNIYSKSVKAHPLEIFLVIMIAGSFAGIPGMMLAIPSYTVLRIIAKEFFSRFYLVKKLTENR